MHCLIREGFDRDKKPSRLVCYGHDIHFKERLLYFILKNDDESHTTGYCRLLLSSITSISIHAAALTMQHYSLTAAVAPLSMPCCSF